MTETQTQTQIKTIHIDDEFKNLLPPLEPETYKALESEIISDNKCRDPLVLWGDILIDGHNRYNICSTHNIPFQTTTKDFKSRDEVLIWIISTQIGRRNLTQEQMVFFRGVHYEMERKAHGGDRGNQYTKEASGNNYHLAKNQNDNDNNTQTTPVQTTADKLAEQYNVSERTIRSDAAAARTINAIGEVDPEAKQKILSGKGGINKRDLENLAKAPKEEIVEAAQKIKDGSWENVKRDRSGSSAVKIDKDFEFAMKPAEKASAASMVMASIRTLGSHVAIVADDFNAILPRVTEEDEREELRNTLKGYIIKLESLCDKI